MAGDETHVAGEPAPLPRKPVAADVLATPGRGLEPRDQPPKRVIVIGGGLAGLVAAFELQRQGHEPLVLEAQNRVGGRIHFAGEHCSLYHAWIQGAMESGIRVARQIHEASAPTASGASVASV